MAKVTPAGCCGYFRMLARVIVYQTVPNQIELMEGVIMKNLVKYMAQALVDSIEVVEVSEIEGDKTSVIELRVSKEDLGKVIGKQGKTAKAMRTILSAASAKLRRRTVLEIIE